ncbi:hypothetical protein [Undibacterium sp. TS12]|uniref:hypothetical protein n=1 Tax=Undibacterium sp. TS12 TaxID=2908202 RepID=UPI001F4D02A4|nr:hypothetical protein [Undibacterium sp. TS12]MCH8620478.1 hypothetical protein [Undibacterium sp. TS12]
MLIHAKGFSLSKKNLFAVGYRFCLIVPCDIVGAASAAKAWLSRHAMPVISLYGLFAAEAAPTGGCALSGSRDFFYLSLMSRKASTMSWSNWTSDPIYP